MQDPSIASWVRLLRHARLCSTMYILMIRVRASVVRLLHFVAVEHGALTVILLVSLGVRLWLLRWWEAFPFGDVFNFVRIARELAHGSYPVDEKRLPFYPLLILLVHQGAPWLRWETIAIGLAIVMSLAALGLLYAICRALRIGLVPSLVAVLLLSSFPPFLSYSIRGYADTTLLALVLAAILTALRARTFRGAALLGFFLGAAILTRYEGVAAAGVLLPLFALRARRMRSIGAAFAVLALTILPYVVVARASGRSLLPATYLTQAARAGEGYGASSVAEFWDRYTTLWRRLGLFELWRTPAGVFRNAREDFLGLHRPLVDLVREPRSATALLAIPGFFWLFLRRQRAWATLLVSAPFFAVAVPIAWWAPQVRYHALLYPLMAFAAAAGVHAFGVGLSRATAGRSGRAVRGGAAAGLLLVASLVWLLSFTQQTLDGLRKSRFRELGTYRALHYVRTLPGVVAFEERRVIIETYFGDRAVYASELFSKQAEVPERWLTLKNERVAFVVASGRVSSPYRFLLAGSPDVRVDEIARYVVEQGNHDLDEALVYRLTKLR